MDVAQVEFEPGPGLGVDARGIDRFIEQGDGGSAVVEVVRLDPGEAAQEFGGRRGLRKESDCARVICVIVSSANRRSLAAVGRGALPIAGCASLPAGASPPSAPMTSVVR